MASLPSKKKKMTTTTSRKWTWQSYVRGTHNIKGAITTSVVLASEEVVRIKSLQYKKMETNHILIEEQYLLDIRLWWE